MRVERRSSGEEKFAIYLTEEEAVYMRDLFRALPTLPKDTKVRDAPPGHRIDAALEMMGVKLPRKKKGERIPILAKLTTVQYAVLRAAVSRKLNEYVCRGSDAPAKRMAAADDLLMSIETLVRSLASENSGISTERGENVDVDSDPQLEE